MPVDAKHAQYNAHREQWDRCRDCVKGQDAVHARGDKYLPKLKEQTSADYDAYRKRALFFNATQRTVEGMVGLVFRKAPTVDAPAGLKPIIDDVTMAGDPLDGYAQGLVEEVLTAGRHGLLVDFPRVDAPAATVAQAEASGARPFVTGYAAESIINWREERIANAMTLTRVVLMEEYSETDPADEFAELCGPQIRVLDLGMDAESPAPTMLRYRQRLYRKPANASAGQQWAQYGDDIVPLKNGAPLDRIPFVFCGVRDNDSDCEKPPVLDLAEVNLSHYRTVADLEHGAHFTGLPTAYVTGYTVDKDVQGKATESFYVGSATAWVFPQAETKVGYLEFTGQGLEALEKREAHKEEQMAALGARMLAPEKRAAEAAETASIHRAGEASVLASLAHTVSEALTQALTIAADWAGIAGKPSVVLNTDYYPVEMDPLKLQALVAAWQQGAISAQTLFDNLKQGEVIAEATTFEQEQADIAASPPLAMQAAQAAIDNPPVPPGNQGPTNG